MPSNYDYLRQKQGVARTRKRARHARNFFANAGSLRKAGKRGNWREALPCLTNRRDDTLAIGFPPRDAGKR